MSRYLIAELAPVVLRRLYEVSADGEAEALEMVRRGQADQIDEYVLRATSMRQHRIQAVDGVFRPEERDDADAA